MRELDHFGLGLVVDRLIAQMEHPVPVVPTGLPKLDGLLDGGMRPGDMFVVAARTRVGKSALALQVALNVLRSGKCVALWSLEMSEEQWARRAVASMASVNPSRMRIGGDALEPEDIRRVSPELSRFKALPLSFARGGKTIEAIRVEAELQVKHNQPALFIIDYLQRIEPSGKRDYNREQEVARVSRMIKDMALDFSVPVMALCQLRRSAEGRVPMLSDLRESGALEQDADEVLLLHRQEDEETHLLKPQGLALLSKNRDGREGIIQVDYDWRHFRFEEANDERVNGGAPERGQVATPKRRRRAGQRDFVGQDA